MPSHMVMRHLIQKLFAFLRAQFLTTEDACCVVTASVRIDSVFDFLIQNTLCVNRGKMARRCKNDTEDDLKSAL